MSFLSKLALCKIAKDASKPKTNDEYIDYVLSTNASVPGGVPKSQLTGAAAKDRIAGNVEQLRNVTAQNVFDRVNGPVVAGEVFGPGKNNVVSKGSTEFVDRHGNSLTREQAITRLKAQGRRNEKAIRTPAAKQEAVQDSEFIDVADPTKREQLRKLLPTIARLNTTNGVAKHASAYTDTIGGIVGGLPFGALAAVPGAAPIAHAASNAVGLGGSIHGLVDRINDPVTELAELEAKPTTALIPGVAASRLMRRQRLVNKLVAKDPSQNANVAAHRWISMINPLNLLASPFAALGAAITDGHTPDERAEVADDENQVLKTWLIPGYGTYQMYKDLGLSNRVGDIDQVINNLKRRGRAIEAAQYERLLRKSKKGSTSAKNK